MRFTLILALTAALGACASAQRPAPAEASLEVDVFTAAPPLGAVTTSLVHGPSELLIVDAQFTKSGAEGVVAAAKAIGKPVTQIFVTHAHPDHYLGTVVLVNAFPDAKVIATEATVAEMKESAVQVAELRREMLGPEFPGMPVIPAPVAELEVDGVPLTILENRPGDTHNVSAIYIESIGTLIGSDLVYVDVHLWTATTDHDERIAWAKEAEELASLPGLKRVIPGHRLTTSAETADTLRYTSEYLRAYEAALSESSSGDELAAKMKERYPKAKMDLFLNFGVQAAFPK